MTKEELTKELELLADSCDSNHALEINGYNRGVLDAESLVNKYFALAPVSGALPLLDNILKEEMSAEMRTWLMELRLLIGNDR